MSKRRKLTEYPPTTGIRLDYSDRELAGAIQKKLGVRNLSEVVRMALRALAREQGVTA